MIFFLTMNYIVKTITGVRPVGIKFGRQWLMKVNSMSIYIFSQKINIINIVFFHLGFSPDKVKIWRNQFQTMHIDIQFLLWVWALKLFGPPCQLFMIGEQQPCSYM